MKDVKIIVEAYGKTFKFSTKKYCGYIKCDRVKKVLPISHDAIPFKSKRGDSFLCSCGIYTDDSPFHHTVFYKGKEIKYGDW